MMNCSSEIDKQSIVLQLLRRMGVRGHVPARDEARLFGLICVEAGALPTHAFRKTLSVRFIVDMLHTHMCLVHMMTFSGLWF
jgi:hypothetical protein